jgi:hypothetical protein
LATSVLPISTARIRSGRTLNGSETNIGKSFTILLLAIALIGGLLLRVSDLGSYSLSEDELNKLMAVEDYRSNGISSTNGEHPMLMKGLLTISIVTSEHWNSLSFVRSNSGLQISTEAALRLPGTVLGALTSLLIFLVASELFGTHIGLIAALLWAFDPTGISFNRIAKEDSFFIFFFLLANLFWLRGQRAAEYMQTNPERYYWATAIAFGAMLASKYIPHFIGISASYYYIFQRIPSTQWRLGKKRWAIFWIIAGISFLLFNPSILLPGTWHEMLRFAGERRIGHDSYEFMNQFYGNKMTLWLKGSPFYFYFLFMFVKLPISVIGSFLIGLLLLFRKELGDGRFFVIIWLVFWFLPFSSLGGKFTRYFTLVLPVILIVAAIGIDEIGRTISRLLRIKGNAQLIVPSIFILSSLVVSIWVMPHYRLYINLLGGGSAYTGYYFPHDEFYDASMQDAVNAAIPQIRKNGYIASETPKVAEYYAQVAGRDDLSYISLSDKEALKQLRVGDAIIVARGRRYLSNLKIIEILESNSSPVATVNLGHTPSAKVFILDENVISAILRILNNDPNQ